MRNQKKKAKQDRYDTAEFDREFVADTFRPLSPASKARWERIQAKGKSKSKVTVELEQDLLDSLDRLAKKKGVSRNSLLKKGIRAVLEEAATH
ncbi:MAG: ribbon-helix-helix protein, CopG family [Gemmataceae bacterium]|nr:ribbon-helix-helix protein, CopG family [Gemmataceae bacterium]MCI0741828.1 ribbon-helix-helix protein, CopG family [Gemmataceae bacterium]